MQGRRPGGVRNTQEWLVRHGCCVGVHRFADEADVVAAVIPHADLAQYETCCAIGQQGYA